MVSRASCLVAIAIACCGVVPTEARAQPAGVAAVAPPAFPTDGALAALLADRMRHNGVGIVVGLIDGPERRVIAHGRASDRPGARPLDGGTIFQIGSVTKGLTTLLLADMVRRGEVSLDEPIGNLLPAEVRLPVVGRPITLRDLATHRSGLPSMPDNLDLAAAPDPYEAYTAERLFAFLSSHVPAAAPGTEARYSNLGVALLGRLLARRAGKEYAALLQERILAPLGMNSTAITPTRAQQPRVAPGHDRYLRPVRTWEMRAMPASGSLRSSADDLLTLIAAYLGATDTPLKPAMDLQLRERIKTARGWQALGWGIRADGIVTHSGSKQGYRAAIAFDPARRRGVVVLANARTEDEPMGLALHLIAGDPLPPAPAAPPPVPIVPLAPALLDRYAGWYCLASGTPLEIARKDRHLLVHTPGLGASEFFATAADAFFLDTGNDELAFPPDPTGGPARRLIHYPDGRGGEPVPGERVTGRVTAAECGRRKR